jgi:two-component system, LytTR family, response regulator
MKALIIDDEQHCIDSLAIMINKYCREVTIIDTCLNGECGLEAIRMHDPDLVFLDISMPKMNGFDMLSRIREINFEIIFTTAYDNYAIQAFKVSAADYLLKPIDRIELVQAVVTVEERIKLKNTAQDQYNKTEQFAVLLENLKHGSTSFPKIALPTLHGLEIQAEADILYLVAEGNYVQVHRRNAKPLLLSKTIKYVEERLHTKYFFRIHNSFLINTREIVRYIKGDGGLVVMSDGKKLNVSKNRKAELIAILRA